MDVGKPEKLSGLHREFREREWALARLGAKEQGESNGDWRRSDDS